MRQLVDPYRYGVEREWCWRGWQSRYSFWWPAAVDEKKGRSPVILLHGFGASLRHWRYNLRVLGDYQPTYALDLIGLGAAEKPIAAYGAEFWAAQVHAFWQKIVGQPAVIVGNSIGALIALTCAYRYPQMAAGVVMLSLPDPAVREELIPRAIAPLVSGIEQIFTAPWLLRTLFYTIRRPFIVKRWAQLAYANPNCVDDELLDILLTPAYDRDSDRAFGQIIRAMSRTDFGPSAKTMLKSVPQPLLLIWGRQDRFIPPMLSQQFQQVQPRMQVVELDHTGHCPHDEQPDRVNALLLDWLRSHELGRG
ncbi:MULTISPECIES: alpha/beta fold hydrolase [unclassified Thermosynechococcus]|uniref:alpha/beta fold hydrolase n=1 Tax=unclassified Thermosynechococcus TaxID=2622553 RepID=UPI00287316DE|nr:MULTISPECIES: alpha/beta fold hydrolase [unclassified Thermosynechococcus]WNC22644.1 alpha/beta fold hydrolase [Thermosynechococcus sp. PP22]WNC32884.1 alpha/beta fold hydrolase [Thermosynechococcus sp. PKX95]WNC35410.1 alpha/beta fold hydrolase [Thermosynechococcus sp. PKX91]WNC37930.1 alpha/beta fold hydrolase [Thermosynechococcus sp. WL11]WNC40452.1 alpha/beta fold hydrolase [Thermosynechococcus sp. WL17]